MLNKSPSAASDAPKMFALASWPLAVNVWQPAIDAMLAWNEAATSTFAAFNRECLEFVKRRTKEDLALAERMAACKSPTEAWSVYADFMQKAAGDYQQEFNALARMGTRAAAQSAALMQHNAETARKSGERVLAAAE